MQNIFSLKANAFFVKCLLLLCLFIYAAITWYSISIIGSTSDSRFLVIVPPIIIGLLLLLIGYIANKYMSKIVFTISLITLTFSIRLIWILNIPTPIESDFAVMYYSAVQAAKGDFSFAQNTYYTSWVYQLGFTMYQAFIIKLFGESPTLLKILNVAYCTGTTLLIYKITSKVFNEWSGRIAGVIYSLYIPSIIMSSVLTNQYISTFFFFLGLYVLITKGFSTKYGWGLTGLLLSIGNIMRPLGSFFLLAVFVYVLIYKILPFRKKETLNYVKKLVGIVIVYFLVMQIVSIFLMNTGLAKKPLSNQMPYWKFVVGFNYDSIGGWNQPDVVYLSQFKLGKERNDASVALIKDRLKDKEKVRQLLVLKVEKMWSNPDDAPGWALEWGELNKPHLQQMLTKYERLMYITCCIFAIGTISLYRRNDSIYPLLYILFGGYVVIHLFVEVQTRYRFDILPVMFLFVGYGVFVIKNGVTRLMGRKQQKKVE